MPVTDPSKNAKATTHHRNNSDTHIRLDAPGGSEESCACSLCRQYEPQHRAKQSKYQDLYPFGLDPPPFEPEDVPDSPPVTESTEMAPASNEEQFKFLISCIRYSNNGKVDFTEVAKECGIVSKGAAAKRYERMMKANGIHQSQSGPTTPSSARDTPGPSSRRKNSPSAGPSGSAPSSKKRKLDDYAETTSNINTDDDESPFNVKTESGETTVKAENVEPGKIKAEIIKEEETAQEGTEGSAASAETVVYPSRGGMGFDGADDSTLFDDFLAFGGSMPAVSISPAAGNGSGEGLPESIVIAD
ncbi:hypothetical protein BDR22DRAFT_969069 [Usnea florida]